MMKYRTKTVINYLIFLVLLVSLFTGGCLGQSSVLSGENGTEKKAEVDDNKSSPTSHLKTESVNLSELGAGNSTFAVNSIGHRLRSYFLLLILFFGADLIISYSNHSSLNLFLFTCGSNA